MKIASFIFLFILHANICFCQKNRSYGSSTADFVSLKNNEEQILSDSLFNIPVSALKDKYPEKKLYIILPDKFYTRIIGGDSVIFGFLFNNSYDTIISSECDGFLTRSTIEVKEKSRWATYVDARGPDCWVDCARQMLYPGEYSVLVVFLKRKGVKRYLFRIKMKIGDKDFFSNIAANSFD